MTDSEALFFASPTEAVTQLTQMLNASDWKTAARYYDLSGTNMRREGLASESFFIKNPAAETRFLDRRGAMRPFTPGFKYERHAPDGADTIRVYLKLEIDQGDGMTLRSLHAFRMRKSQRGYQVLPDEVSYFEND